ncbi:MAG TPA: hypothetical protein PKO06_15550 [Candidatus Ozemobacteraceae bacterium]|nr:hypothetical protein [Candidatus Ozemobacteraceae bacterium]
MNFRLMSVVFVLLSLLLLPACITGCGVDDTDSMQTRTNFTIGPGNLEDYSTVASGS